MALLKSPLPWAEKVIISRSITDLHEAECRFMNKETRRSPSFLEHSAQLPTTIAESIARIKTFALQEFDREIAQKQLYYHTREHVNNVERRANKIFQAVSPHWQTETASDIEHMKLLLELCAIAHDMVQEFIAPTGAHASRQREPGVSEKATIKQLLEYINQLNQLLASTARLTDDDITIIEEAIAATICAYDPQEQAIYQPDLYHPQQPLSPVARILALADIGALGIDGIKVYQQEGSLLFLEENLDVLPLLLDGTVYSLSSKNPQLYRSLQQRLLSRCRFQVSFAKSRLARLEQEIADFPAAATATLKQEVFKYLNVATIQELVAATPTHENASLETLLQFFELERYIKKTAKDSSILARGD